MHNFDVIVVGAGHAGIEACLAPARLGLSVALVTNNADRLGYMSCNPSIGGLAKGHMVREIDILGGEMGAAADATCIQFKRLNSGKGPAVRGTRVQNDKALYSEYMKTVLQQQSGLQTIIGEVKSLILANQICEGVVLKDGSQLFSKKVIITTGTFLNAVMHFGLKQIAGGRIGDQASKGISDQLSAHGFTVRRLKTGTPARLDRDSIDWSKTEPQFGDKDFFAFSLRSGATPALKQVPCYLSRTTQETHQIIRDNLHLSPMYCGVIEGVGPRYCPSIEDKVVRFGDREGHQTFLEPEGLTTNSIYLQGISTSLPEDVQDRFLVTIPGLEKVKVLKYGYAVEYDFVEPTQIWHTLETREIKNLYLAGQINGTSGYEEAAAQGLVAGVNAAHSVLEKDAFILGRDQAYIGVLIDDLVTKGTLEPYRMFTSRAEHRLVLREDNTLDRLNSHALGLGLASNSILDLQTRLLAKRLDLFKIINESKIYPNPTTQLRLEGIGTVPLLKSVSMAELLCRPEVRIGQLQELGLSQDLLCSPQVSESVEISVKYQGYIKRQNELIAQARKFEDLILPQDLAYFEIRGLSREECEKLIKVRPRTLGQAGRISGVNPSAIQAIMVYLKGTKDRQQEAGIEQVGQT